MPKVYSQTDVSEMQKSFNNTLKGIHSNLFYILMNKNNTKVKILELVNYVSDEMKVIEKDIKISECAN